MEQAKRIGYSERELQSIPESAIMGLGCGNPTALADLKEREIVLDLGFRDVKIISQNTFYEPGLDCTLAGKITSVKVRAHKS